MKSFKNVLSIFIISIIASSAIGQTYAPSDYYLIDSLNLTELSEVNLTLIDSTLKEFHSCDTDTCKAMLIGYMVEKCYDNNVWPKYNRWLLEFAQRQLKVIEEDDSIRFVFEKISASALSNIGYLYNITGEDDLALSYYQKAFIIQQILGDKEGMSSTLINIGSVYRIRGLLSRALESFYHSLRLMEETDNLEGKSLVYNTIGYIYYTQHEFNSAIDYYQQSLEIRKKLNNEYGIATVYSNLGLVYVELGDLDTAINYFEKAITLEKKISDYDGVAVSLQNIGSVLEKQDKRTLALEKYNESMAIHERNDNPKGICSVLHNVASIQLDLGNLSEAKLNGLKSLSIAEKLNFIEGIRNATEILYQIEEKLSNWKESLRYYRRYILMKDSITNDDNLSATISAQFEYKIQKKAIVDSIQKTEELTIKQSEIDLLNLENEKKDTNRLLFIIGLLFLAILSGLFINRNRIIRRQNQEISSSIQYAKQLQESVLPTNKKVSTIFPDSFVLYKPKDIVSGDFYVIDFVNVNDEQMPAFIVGDCTGHGVPGAVLSLMSNVLVQESFSHQEVKKPSEALDFVRKRLIKFLSSEENITRDGMDIGFCILNKKASQIYFSGANISCVIVRDSKIIEYKGGRQHVGYSETLEPFTNQVIDVKKNDCIYLYSDGYRDQFGGDRNKKFSKKRLHRILTETSYLPMNDIGLTLDRAFLDWKKEEEQLDDVTVMGIRIE